MSAFSTHSVIPIFVFVSSLQRIFQKGVLKTEILLDTSAPPSLVIKVDVGSLLVFIRRHLWFFVTLEPSHVLFVEPPGLLLQFTSSQVLLVRSLSVVEDEEQAVGAKLFKDLWVVKDGARSCRVACRSWVRVLWRVLARSFVVRRVRHGSEGIVEGRKIGTIWGGVGAVATNVNACER